MRWVSLPGRRALIYSVLIALLGGLFLGMAFIFSGIYNVAASVQHFDITNALIRLTLRRSVETRSVRIEQPPENLSDEALARLGARHYALGCAPCHASPSATQSPVTAQMYPVPPPLSRAAEHWETDELFWIVKNGLKFTGMPAWPAQERDEEIWSLVAFLERLPEMSAEEYATLAGQEEQTGGGAVNFGFVHGPRVDVEEMTAFCATCHGDAKSAPVHALAPGLAGQKRDYLQRALTEYAENRRPSGMMEPLAAELGPDAIERLARYYADAPAEAAPPSRPADPDAIRRGGIIATNGVQKDDIPACVSCHSAGASGQFPRLNGLSAGYIATQLRLFHDGVRKGSTYAAIMASIARRLNQQQISDVAAYFASRAAPAGQDAAASEAAE